MHDAVKVTRTGCSSDPLSQNSFVYPLGVGIGFV